MGIMEIGIGLENEIPSRQSYPKEKLDIKGNMILDGKASINDIDVTLLNIAGRIDFSTADVIAGNLRDEHLAADAA